MLTCVIPIASYHKPKGDCRERDGGASVPRARRRATVHCHHHRWASKLSRSTQDPDGVSPSALRKGGRCTPSVSFRIDCELPPLFMLTCTPMVYHVTALLTGRMVTLRQASFGNSMVCNAHHARTPVYNCLFKSLTTLECLFIFCLFRRSHQIYNFPIYADVRVHFPKTGLNVLGVLKGAERHAVIGSFATSAIEALNDALEHHGAGLLSRL